LPSSLPSRWLGPCAPGRAHLCRCRRGAVQQLGPLPFLGRGEPVCGNAMSENVWVRHHCGVWEGRMNEHALCRRASMSVSTPYSVPVVMHYLWGPFSPHHAVCGTSQLDPPQPLRPIVMGAQHGSAGFGLAVRIAHPRPYSLIHQHRPFGDDARMVQGVQGSVPCRTKASQKDRRTGALQLIGKCLACASSVCGNERPNPILAAHGIKPLLLV